MRRGRERLAALTLAAVGLATSGAMVASGSPANANTTPRLSCLSGYACNDEGPLATQAACEAARAPSRPPDYYSFPCYYGYETFAPYDGGQGWYWTYEASIR